MVTPINMRLFAVPSPVLIWGMEPPYGNIYSNVHIDYFDQTITLSTFADGKKTLFGTFFPRDLIRNDIKNIEIVKLWTELVRLSPIPLIITGHKEMFVRLPQDYVLNGILAASEFTI